MASDKKTIGIAKSNAASLARLVSSGNFSSELDAAKFAMAHAIKTGAQGGTAEGAETKWNVGSVDPDGSMRSLIEALFPDVSEPYRVVEYLMNEGIRLLAADVTNPADLYDKLFAR